MSIRSGLSLILVLALVSVAQGSVSYVIGDMVELGYNVIPGSTREIGCSIQFSPSDTGNRNTVSDSHDPNVFFYYRGPTPDGEYWDPYDPRWDDLARRDIVAKGMNSGAGPSEWIYYPFFVPALENGYYLYEAVAQEKDQASSWRMRNVESVRGASVFGVGVPAPAGDARTCAELGGTCSCGAGFECLPSGRVEGSMDCPDTCCVCTPVEVVKSPEELCRELGGVCGCGEGMVCAEGALIEAGGVCDGCCRECVPEGPLKVRGLLSSSHAAAGSDVEAYPGEPVHFDGSGTSGGTGALRYRWLIEGMEPFEGVSVTRPFASPGVYTGRLEVTDGAGTTAEGEPFTVTVKEKEEVPDSLEAVAWIRKPDGELAKSITVEEGSSVDFDGSLSGPEEDIDRYVWFFGEDTMDGETVSRVYNDEGTYKVSLGVVDDDNKRFDRSEELTVEVVAAGESESEDPPEDAFCICFPPGSENPYWCHCLSEEGVWGFWRPPEVGD